MYRFYDKITDEIISKYGLRKNIVRFETEDENEYIEGLKYLSVHTCSILDKMNDINDYGAMLLNETMRFLVKVYKYQKYSFRTLDIYYTSILNKFHELGYLKYKHHIQEYKIYKNKKFIYKINYNLGYKNFTLVYHSLRNLIIDYGRYRTDKIIELYPKYSTLNYQCLKEFT